MQLAQADLGGEPERLTSAVPDRVICESTDQGSDESREFEFVSFDYLRSSDGREQWS